MHSLAFDVAHLLAGGLVLVSFMMLYQDRLYALLNIFAVHALVLAASVAWQAYVQDAPHLYITAIIALGFKAIVVPVAPSPPISPAMAPAMTNPPDSSLNPQSRATDP